MNRLVEAARMAHLAAYARRCDILKNSVYPVRAALRPDGTYEFVTVWPDPVRTELNTLESINRAFAQGCAALASFDPGGAHIAHLHFRRTLQEAGIPWEDLLA